MKILLWNIHTGVDVTDFVTQVIRAKERDRRGSVVGKRVLICVTSFAYDPLWQTKKCGTQRIRSWDASKPSNTKNCTRPGIEAQDQARGADRQEIW